MMMKMFLQFTLVFLLRSVPPPLNNDDDDDDHTTFILCIVGPLMLVHAEHNIAVSLVCLREVTALGKIALLGKEAKEKVCSV